ncbi:FAD-dependent oxidoreductase [Roseateles koreensis]|uniref:FAD-dependent oxidoreductase n=1 Tax=Roseateles koreensis TaxID=2987526 RepID=A0ABT5KLA6_9BURK|nr:FAD-dependent oxidoreductase [Roseateles koreensis]MDC8783673.1 FAD-dependent oxidoreductase [Roseateles koreensis]
MRIAIIGAGIAGVTTAYELSAQGHQVTVFDRCGSVAAEGSFANAGIVAPAMILPWTAKPWPHLSLRHSLGWQWQRRRAAKASNPAAQEQLLKLAQFSLDRLQTLRRSLQLDYERTEGLLMLLRTERERQQIQPGLERLAQMGLSATTLDAEQCRRIEPGLNPEQALLGGIYLPQAEIGNCRQFAHLLRMEAQRLGAQFRFHTTVRSITPGSPAQLVHEYTPPEERPGPSTRQGDSREPKDNIDTQPAPAGPQHENFDAIVVCAGVGAIPLLQPLGFKLPMVQLQGESLTAPLRQLEAHPDLGPRAGLVDQTSGISISRIGQRVRLSISGHWNRSPSSAKDSHAAMHKVLNDWFPGAMQNGQLQQWRGTHAHVADGLPILGTSGHAGIWLNLALEPSNLLSWTLANGAANVLSHQISGNQAGPDLPEISDLTMGRLG